VAPGVPTDLTIAGTALANVVSVELVRPGTGERVSPSWGQPGAGTYLARFTVPSAWTGSLDLELTTDQGTDRLLGWVVLGAGTAPDPPPAAVTNLTGAATGDSAVLLQWTAPADYNGQATGPVSLYELRRLGGSPGSWSWDTGTPLPAPTPGSPGTSQLWAVGGLAAGSTVAFALKCFDDAGQVSPLSNILQVTLPSGSDRPTRVTNLVAEVLDTTTVRLVWSAPAATVGGSPTAVGSYEMRRLAGGPGTWSWGGGTWIAPPAGPPKNPGETETLLLPGHAVGAVVAYALVSRDAAGQVSEVSNFAVADLSTLLDLEPPTRITDLSAAIDSVAGGIRLAWTAPADESGLFGYEFRRLDVAGDAFVWDAAVVVPNPPAPGNPGSAASWIVGEVAAGEVASFGLVCRDIWNNVSEVSNVVSLDRRDEDFQPPAFSGGLEASRLGPGAVQLRWRAPGDDGLLGRADHYELRYKRNANPASQWWLTEEGTILPQDPRASGKLEYANVSGLEAPASYGFAVRAFDEAGLASNWIQTTIGVDGPPDDETAAAAPTAPDGLTCMRTPDGVALSWNEVPDPAVAGYGVYRTLPGGLQERRGTVPSGDQARAAFLDSESIPSGTRYAVVSETADGLESAIGALVEVVDPHGGPGVIANPQGSGWRLDIPSPPGESPVTAIEPRISIFDVQGRLLARPQAVPEGNGWSAVWESRATSGRRIPTGIAFVRVVQGTRVEVTKLWIRP
jgi:hypothetical protein